MNQFKGSVALEHMHHAYAKTDGTYDFPNSREGDILRRCKKELEHLIELSDNSDYATAVRKICEIGQADEYSDIQKYARMYIVATDCLNNADA